MGLTLIKQQKPQKGIPTDQSKAPRVTYTYKGKVYIITSDIYYKTFVCWRVEGNTYIKEAAADNPMLLYEYIEGKRK